MSDDPNESTEARSARFLRAREVLNGAGWLFDDFVNAEMAKILKTAPEDTAGRERAYLRAAVAAELKIALMATVQEQQDEQTLRDHKERRHGRSDQHVN